MSLFLKQDVLDAKNDDIKLYRALSDEYRNSKTLWLSFSIRKVAGSGRFGLSLLENSREKLFIGSVGQNKTIFFGSEKCREKMENAVQLIVRVEKNKAYLFINPPLASVPDIEGASMTLSGDFSFDRIAFVCGKGNTGEFSRVVAGEQFADVVFPRKSNDDLRSMGKQPVISWKKERGALWINTESGILRLKPYEFGALSVHLGSLSAIESENNYAVPQELPERSFQ